MKSRLLILILLVISITIPVTSFAEHPIQTEKPQDSFHKGTIEWVIHCNIGRVYSSTVRVIDYDMNQDPEKIEQFNIEVWSDNEDRIVDYTVTETGNNTGIFDSTIFYKTTDESSGGRIRAVPGSIVFVKYVDYTLPNGDIEKDIIDTFVKSELPASGWRDGDIWKITYDPCMVEYLDKNKNSLDWFSIFYPAPLKQIESGLNNDEIQCKESLTLVTKHDGSPAYVKEQTIPKLIERGWGTMSLDQTIPVSCTTKLDQEDRTYLVRYNIDNAEITDMKMKPYTLIISTLSSNNGSLYLELPRGLIDSLKGHDLQDEIFFVLHDGIEIEYKELKTTKEYRLLKIDFVSDTKQIDIIGTVPLPISDKINTCE